MIVLKMKLGSQIIDQCKVKLEGNHVEKRRLLEQCAREMYEKNFHLFEGIMEPEFYYETKSKMNGKDH